MLTDLKSLKILYVEDDPMTREEILFSLTTFVGTIYTAENGEIGKELFYTHLPDLIITDIQMPVMDGLSMISAIKQTHPKIPVIIMTAFNDTSYLFKAIELGITQYVTKPVNLKNLLSKVDEIAEQITLKKKAHWQEKLLSQYKNAIDETMAVSKTDLGGIITYVNEKYCLLSGYTQEEIIGHRHSFFRALHEKNHNLDERVRTEIAHRREQEQILIQQSRFAAMGEMIGNIAHQWRQPLNALSLLLQNISNAYETGRLDEALIKRVNEKGIMLTTTMSTTIDDFRNFFKPNRNKELFDVSVQLNKVLLMMSASFEDNRIETTLSLEPDLQINGFANEFSQALLNILNNAKEALIEMQKNHRLIQIRGYRQASELCLEISDNAGGINEQVIDKIFDPYFTTKDEGKGTGIGLYMSKVIVETNMHGKLSVRNDQDGAVFVICLPYSYEQETA
jgi:PAS domain S-box-containing protein